VAQHALGEVKPASTVTALRATNNIPNTNLVLESAANVNKATALMCQAICFQALSTNTGSVFICDKDVPSLTLNVIFEIIAPSATSRPSFTLGNPGGRTPINAANIWILPAVSGEGVRVSIVQ